MIVRFTTTRHRTAGYFVRKNSSSYRAKPDLAKKRVDTAERICRLLESRKLGVAFVYINCRLCVRINGKFYKFDNEDQLMEIANEAVLNNEGTVDDDSKTVITDEGRDE